jgi:hypothetical protein
MGMGYHQQPIISWSPAQTDMILKIDAKLKVCIRGSILSFAEIITRN